MLTSYNKHMKYLFLLSVIILVGCQTTRQNQTFSGSAFVEKGVAGKITYDKQQSALFSELLLAELALQQQNNQEAYRRYLAIAETTKSPQAYGVAYALALREQDYKNAYILAQKWVVVDAKNLRAHKALAISALQQGDIGVVIDTLSYLEKAEGAIPDRQFIVLYDQYKLTPSEQSVEAIMRHAPATVRKRLWVLFLGNKVIHAYFTQGKIKKAQALFNTIVAYKAKPRKDLQALTERYAEQLYINQMYLQIMQGGVNSGVDKGYFANLVNSHSNYYSLRYHLAEQYSLLLEAGDEKRAHMHLRTLLSKKTNPPLKVYRQALLLAAQLQMPFDFDTLISRLPANNEDQQVHKERIRATVLANLYKYDTALAILQKLFNQGYKQLTLPSIVDILYKKGDQERAYEATSLIQHQSSLASTVLKANLLHNIHKYEQSNQIIDTWLTQHETQKSAPNTETHLQDLLQLYILQAGNQFFLGNTEAMINDIDVRLEQYPEQDILLNSFGFMLTEAGTQLLRASDMIEKAVHAKPTNAAYLDSLGWVEYKLGNFKKAAQLLTMAYQFFPGAEIEAHLAATYQALGKQARARRMYRRIWLTDRTSRFLPNDFVPKTQ